MDPVYWILLAGIVLGLICLAGEAFIKHLNEKDRINDNRWLQSMVKDDDWDEDWLRQVKVEHVLTAIRPCKVGLMGKPPFSDGMMWVCKCGKKKGCMNLKIAKFSFGRHLEDERDKALAAIGRFE